MKTRQINVVQTRLYPADTISLTAVMTKSVSDRLQQQFGFQSYAPQTNAQGTTLMFTAGTYSDPDQGSVYPVPHLVISGRHIEFRIEARSELADRYFSELAGFLAPMLPNNPDLSALVVHKTEVTTSVSELDFDLAAVVNPRFNDFLARIGIEALAQPGHRAVLTSPVQLSIGVTWVPTEGPPRVRLTNKLLRLELRQGTRPDERVFFVVCPTDSTTHDKLLRSLEEEFARGSLSMK